MFFIFTSKSLFVSINPLSMGTLYLIFFKIVLDRIFWKRNFLTSGYLYNWWYTKLETNGEMAKLGKLLYYSLFFWNIRFWSLTLFDRNWWKSQFLNKNISMMSQKISQSFFKYSIMMYILICMHTYVVCYFSSQHVFLKKHFLTSTRSDKHFLDSQ